MSLQALFTAPAGAPLIWRQGRAIRRGQVAHAARQLALRLPEVGCCINLCQGRLAFIVTLLACALRRQFCLLPHNHTESALLPLRLQHPDATLLDDRCIEDLDFAAGGVGDDSGAAGALADLAIDPQQGAAVLYTSGSTGVPVGHARTWGELAGSGDVDCELFAGDAALNVVATVPSQHMYGLQTSVLLPLRSRCAVHDGRPFFPADIAAALVSVPAPRALVTTPTHLRACLGAGIALPNLNFVLSATAPLAAALAAEAESAWQTRVLEIYGSTEAGTIGTRRSTAGEDWTLTPGSALGVSGDGYEYLARYMPQAVPIADQLTLIDSRRFRLLGRSAEFIKLAGKRVTLGELTQALLAVEGVVDGVVVLPPGAERTVALVVAPGCSREQILSALRERVDPVFLPRPLLQVLALPRSEVGKLKFADLLELVRNAASDAHG